MKISTSYHGDIEIDNQQTLTFNQGIPGFLEETEFVILPLPEAEAFQVLQSIQTKELAFIITDPFQFFLDYDFQLELQEIEKLQLQQAEDAAVYVLLTMSDSVEKITANLQAPVIINTKQQLAKQVILMNTAYETKHRLFE
ncbi:MULTISPECIES: flagellar assembly protein FliW [Priestia]|jgi:flagellar assembly factor FliW|uniref:Flagellar assembly factor FliW n=3 Tax=Priestia TaxID=2800373 RepID=D5DWC3_PRIM1|nr:MULTISPECIES: flagellar assembly protein FliW [Priestia]AVX10948.1 flagellar assembly protein FliW [Bacillus sp. Y-01]KOP77010.1 flagellar biosynthesis protein FliW [Bacillus sp. FJAT-21351]KQU18191.1 flagellar biosynthesis protein FliW [Bacillus sp. Leaf75]KRF47519.1 flagellar biosynthesis protein FliW [Bacillus sp. Soil531]MBZ5481861.1 flagellar assembly protein FliW [Bacillus sp. T_4]MCF6798961.1 flagellar assembly protein FliW [Bacillus sp. ET1]MDH6651897.1 flagellar assembly factor F